MKDFDEARRRRRESVDRDFTLGGQQFRVKPGVRPEELAPFSEINEETPIMRTLEIVDEVLLALIEDTPDDSGVGAHDRYRLLRAQNDDPITVEDLMELSQWIMEVQTGRPTVRPGVS